MRSHDAGVKVIVGIVPLIFGGLLGCFSDCSSVIVFDLDSFIGSLIFFGLLVVVLALALAIVFIVDLGSV